MKTTTTLVSTNGLVTITVFAVEGGHYYADQSNVEELEWLGFGPKAASRFISRRRIQGWR